MGSSQVLTISIGVFSHSTVFLCPSSHCWWLSSLFPWVSSPCWHVSSLFQWFSSLSVILFRGSLSMTLINFFDSSSLFSLLRWFSTLCWYLSSFFQRYLLLTMTFFSLLMVVFFRPMAFHSPLFTFECSLLSFKVTFLFFLGPHLSVCGCRLHFDFALFWFFFPIFFPIMLFQ